MWSTDAERVAVYGTLQEATDAGAKRRGVQLVTDDGWIVVTPASLAAVDGLRVREYRVTTSATEHRNWERLARVLRRSVSKTQG